MNRRTFHVLLLLIVVAWSCEQEGDVSISRPEPTPSTANEASSSSCEQEPASQMTEAQALEEINYSFKSEFEPIQLEQVEGLSRQQFEEFLDGSQISSIKEDLLPVLSAEGARYLLLRNVILQGTGRVATVALIKVPKDLHKKFKPAIFIVSPGNIMKQLKACFSKVSIPSSSGETLCLTSVKFISAYASCPSDECVGESPVVEPPVS